MTAALTEIPDLNALKNRLEKNPGLILESLLEPGKITMAQLIQSLPETMWKRIDGGHFVDVLSKMATLGKVTVIMHTPDVIMEISGSFPEGEFGHGFYNLKGSSSGLHGHLRPNRCGSIYFVERPFMKKTTASIQFMNVDGNTMFKIFLGRDEDGQIFADQMEAFRAMAELKAIEAAA